MHGLALFTALKWTRTRVRPSKLARDVIDAQRASLLVWAPFALALGIGGYFSLKFEPDKTQYLLIAVTMLSSGILAWKSGYLVSIFLTCLSLIALGFLAAGFSAHQKSAPVLKYHYYGPIIGRITTIDRSSSDKPRISLTDVYLRNMPPEKTPKTVRISLHYPVVHAILEPGRMVMITASLSPPAGPAEPGGFDFQRLAWFRGLGAVGYARTPVLEYVTPDTNGFALWLARIRMQLAKGIRSRITGQNGAFAAAILTGDRLAISPGNLAKLRASNLAHLLAISGLHMGLLTGFVFAVIRYSIAAIPYLALRLPLKKIAATGAFLAALSYLFLSGANVATQRAFVMVAVMLVAILLDRRAVTMRAVALAAVIVLVTRPESLIEAGFQMSFAATTALVAVFAMLRDLKFLRPQKGVMNAAFRWGFALILSSAIAGLATAPISAFHFNQIAKFGLLANLASVPVMGFLVMPAAVVAIMLAPFGLDGVFWNIMGAGIGWILSVADMISGMDGSVIHIRKPPTEIIALISGGMLAHFLLKTRARFLPPIAVVIGFILWAQVERPKVLLSPNGRLLGVMTDGGRALNRQKGSGFVAQNWLENDGDAATQVEASHRIGSLHVNRTEIISIGKKRIAYQWGKHINQQSINAMCGRYDIVIVPQSDLKLAGCVVLNSQVLRKLGSVSIDLRNGQLIHEGARQITGTRLWSNK